MEISVSDAKGQLTDLVRQAEAGEDVVLTRHGEPVARLVSIKRALTREERVRVIEKFQAAVKDKILPGPCAARSQDFLYDESGLPK